MKRSLESSEDKPQRQQRTSSCLSRTRSPIPASPDSRASCRAIAASRPRTPSSSGSSKPTFQRREIWRNTFRMAHTGRGSEPRSFAKSCRQLCSHQFAGRRSTGFNARSPVLGHRSSRGAKRGFVNAEARSSEDAFPGGPNRSRIEKAYRKDFAPAELKATFPRKCRHSSVGRAADL